MNKTDLYNGNIKKEHRGMVNFTLIFVSLVLIGLGILLLLIALLYENVENATRIAMFVVSGICFAFGMLNPIFTIKLVRIYPKHKKIAYFFLKPYVFEDKQTEV